MQPRCTSVCSRWQRGQGMLNRRLRVPWRRGQHPLRACPAGIRTALRASGLFPCPATKFDHALALRGSQGPRPKQIRLAKEETHSQPRRREEEAAKRSFLGRQERWVYRFQMLGNISRCSASCINPLGTFQLLATGGPVIHRRLGLLLAPWVFAGQERQQAPAAMVFLPRIQLAFS